jgi:putative MFS transporter
LSEPLPTPSETAPGIPPVRRRSVQLGLFGSTPDFTARQWRVFLIATTAGFFDNYDRALLSLALKQIQKGLRISEAALGTMLSVIRLGYVFSLFITPLADVFGRRRLLLYTVVAYTVFTGLSAAAPNERVFTVWQMLARAFAGAEGTVALVILSEEVDAGVRGWAIGLLSALVSVGYGLAALAFAGIDVMPYGWRGLYALALIPLAVIIPLRRVLPESRRFEREQQTGERLESVLAPLKALFHAYPTRLAMLVAVGFLGNLGGNAAGFFFPKYLQEAHGWLPGDVSRLYFLGGGLGILGNIVAGRMSDRFGRRRMGSLFFLIAPFLTIWLYSTRTNLVIPIWVVELFFDVAGSTIVTAYGVELFPTSYRSTAGSALAVAGTTGGALGLFLEGVLYRSTGSHWIAVCYLTIFWMVAPVIIFFSFPETAGRELEAISPESPSLS